MSVIETEDICFFQPKRQKRESNEPSPAPSAPHFSAFYRFSLTPKRRERCIRLADTSPRGSQIKHRQLFTGRWKGDGGGEEEESDAEDSLSRRYPRATRLLAPEIYIEINEIYRRLRTFRIPATTALLTFLPLPFPLSSTIVPNVRTLSPCHQFRWN